MGGSPDEGGGRRGRGLVDPGERRGWEPEGRGRTGAMLESLSGQRVRRIRVGLEVRGGEEGPGGIRIPLELTSPEE